MLEIDIEPRRTLNLRQAVLDSIESGEYETLQTDIRGCFTDEQIESIETALESGDIEETIDDIITEWAGDDLEDLIEIIESYFTQSSIQLSFEEADEIIEDGQPDDLDEIEEELEEEDAIVDGESGFGDEF